MFYPQGINLSRRERLSLIWLAANYDPDKYKKLITARDCEGTNIAKICETIMNPTVPLALRLSAQLLLGTVRIYRTKTKLCLELAEQMMLRLSSLMKEASDVKLVDLKVGTLRAEVITLASPGISMVDYSLEPVYYDPQLMMHINEDDFLSLTITPMHSPIKYDCSTKEAEKCKPQTPLTVSKRKISIDEDLLSPTKQIQLPGYEDGFGPAHEDFLIDLTCADKVDFNIRLADVVHLATVFEDEQIGKRQEIMDDSGRKKSNGTLSKVVRKLQISDEEPSEIEDQQSDLDKILKDVLALNESVQQKTEENRESAPDHIHLLEEVADNPIDLILEQTVPGIDNVRFDDKEITAVMDAHDWALDLVTPVDVIVLKPQERHPKWKRKLKIDKEMILDSNDIRNNLATPETLTRIPIIAGTALAKGKDLFTIPILADHRYNKRIKQIWNVLTINEDNTDLYNKRTFLENISEGGYVTTQCEKEFTLEKLNSPEIARQLEETSETIDIPRAGSTSLHSFEQSAGSLVVMNQTPQEDKLSVRSLDHIELNLDDPLYKTLNSPRISDIGIIPPEIDLNLNDIMDLEPVIEEGELTMVHVNVTDEEFSKRFFHYQKKIYSCLSDSKTADFMKLFPQHKTKKKDAVLGFYALLHLRKNNQISLDQPDLFGDITIRLKEN